MYCIPKYCCRTYSTSAPLDLQNLFILVCKMYAYQWVGKHIRSEEDVLIPTVIVFVNVFMKQKVLCLVAKLINIH